MPFTGLEWSFKLKDEGYGCDGLLPAREYDNESNRVKSRNHPVNPGLPDSDEEEDEVEMITITSLTEGIGGT